MPYIITTGEPWGRNLGARDKYAVTSRCAVATLEEARQEVYHLAATALGDDMERRLRVSLPDAEGGSVSLPDGSVIEVERQPDDFDVDAYNAAQEVPA